MPEHGRVYVHTKGMLSAKGVRVAVKLCGHRQRALGSEGKGSNGDSKAVLVSSEEACFRQSGSGARTGKASVRVPANT